MSTVPTRSSPPIEHLELRRLLAVTPVPANQLVMIDDNKDQVVLVDTSGNKTPVEPPGVKFTIPQFPVLSPDRTKIALVNNSNPNDSSGADIFIMNADGSGFQQLTNNNFADIQPHFSPDGSKIVFTSDRDGNEEIYEMNADGTGVTRLTNNSADDESPSFSPDGSTIIFDSHRSGDYHIYRMDAGTGANVQPLTTGGGFDDIQPAYSADGDQIAFISTRGGKNDLWIMNADGSNPFQDSFLDSTDDAFSHPTWSPDGNEIALEEDGTDSSSVVTLFTDEVGSGPEQLLDGAAFPSWASAPAFAGVAFHVLTVHGTAAADSISIGQDLNTLTVTENGQTESFSPDQIRSIQVFCGAGNDLLDASQLQFPMYASGDAGDDELIGGFNNDTLTGGSGRNTLFGGDGDDRLNGSNGRDFLYGENGNDRCYGNGGNDYIVGGAGVDRMWGGDGDDLISGNSGNDKMFGEAGNDQLLGGDGNDIVYGGPGVDTLNGGKGTDASDADGSDVLIQIEVLP